MLKENFIRRKDAMIGYVTEKDVCRARYLMAYFGQKESEDCVKCDLCRAGDTQKSRLEKLRDRKDDGDVPSYGI